MLNIDANSDVPVFQQIVNGLKAAVARGALKPGDTIPSVRQTASDAVVNPNTVAKAYRELEREQIIFTRRGVGMVVAEGAEERCMHECRQSLRRSMQRLIADARAAGMSDSDLLDEFRGELKDPNDDAGTG